MKTNSYALQHDANRSSSATADAALEFARFRVPPRPDVSRFAFPSTLGMSGYYAQQNAGKRNVSIDLNVRGARELALRLCDTADVVVENFRAGTLGFFGLDYETLAARNPRLIYASITGHGQGGPWQGRMAYAPTVQAEAGFTTNSIRHYGEALGEPRTDSLSHADVYAGLQAAIAILAALHRRETTGPASTSMWRWPPP